MATTAAATTGAVRADLFWQRMAIGLALFILFGFLQFSLRGIVDPIHAPFWVHLHGLAMLGWLGLLIVQPRLVARDNLALHRRIGRIGAGLAIVMVGLALFTGLAAIATHRQPPFFSPPYFLMLNIVEASTFGAMVAWAVRRRGATDWHRRLMIGATIILLGPALGRILPLPLMVGWSDLPMGIGQLVAVAIVARHDWRTLGRVHPATWATALVVVAVRVTVPLLAMTPLAAGLAARLAGG